MEKMMHLAAQYLAAAGKSFVPKKDDDSHTNLGFLIEDGSFRTHSLSDRGDMLSLNYKKFTLDWISKGSSKTLRLDGATHEEVLNWLMNMSKTTLNKTYNYDLHYELPYTINNSFMFKLLNTNTLNELLHLRILAQLVLENILETNALDSEIRTWPHHFDTGAYAKLKNSSDISVGLGLAVPDALHDQHYFYISGYRGHDTLNTSKFDKLTYGEWKSDGFMGAILPASGTEESEALLFFNEALNSYKIHS